MLPSKYLIGICMTSLWISCSSCCNYFGCTSFFVDIYHHDFIYLEPYTFERNYISRWYPFFHVHLVFLMIFIWWLRESFCLECVSSIVASWCTLVCGEDYFPHAYLYEAFAILIGIPCLDGVFIFYLHQGCHKHRFSICLLVSLWTHSLVVCGNDRPCTVCLILWRLYWCLMLFCTLVFSSALPWLTHIFLVEPTLKLPLLLVAQPCVCCKS